MSFAQGDDILGRSEPFFSDDPPLLLNGEPLIERTPLKGVWSAFRGAARRAAEDLDRAEDVVRSVKAFLDDKREVEPDARARLAPVLDDARRKLGDARTDMIIRIMACSMAMQGQEPRGIISDGRLFLQLPIGSGKPSELCVVPIARVVCLDATEAGIARKMAPREHGANVRVRGQEFTHLPGPRPPVPAGVPFRQFVVTHQDFDADRYGGYGLTAADVAAEIARFGADVPPSCPYDIAIWSGEEVAAVVRSGGDGHRPYKIIVPDWAGVAAGESP